MVVLRYVVPALAVVSGVLAQCSTKGTLTITNTADATKIATCQTYTGSIAINSKAAGDIALDGPTKITGNVVAVNAKNLNSLSGASLKTIEGTLNLTQLNSISAVTFPMLSTVDTLWFQALSPAFTTLGFTAGLTSIKSLSIITTYLTSLEGIGITTADNVQILTNPDISQLSLPFTDITTSLMVRGNLNGLALTLPKLKTADVITINDCSAVSLPALIRTTGLLAVDGNEMKTLSFPKLMNAASFDVSGNTKLSKLSAPKLTTVGGTFSIAYNTALTGTLSFPDLEIVKGGPNITGTFTGLSLPKLKSVLGHSTIRSDKNIDGTICKEYQKLTPSVFQGGLDCTGKASKSSVNHSGGGGGSSGGGSTTGSNSGNGNSAAGHYEASLVSVFAMFAVIGSAFAWLV